MLELRTVRRLVAPFPRLAGLAGALATAAALTLAVLPGVHAQEGFPRGPVKLVVTHPPGTVPDVIARALGQTLQESWKQSVVIENKPGAGGAIAAETVAKATPDGLTLLMGSDGLLMLPLVQKFSFNPLTELKPISLVGAAPLILVVHPSLKVGTLAELVALAKSSPKPLNYASYGIGTLHHRAMMTLERAAGVRFGHIPYGSKSPIPDLLAGEVPVMWAGLSGVLPHIQSGKLVALATSGAKRLPALPNVAAAAELGYPGFDVVTWMGVMAPVGTPAAIARRLETDIMAAASTQAFRERVAPQGTDPLHSTSEEFARRIAGETERNRALLGSQLGSN